MRISRKKRPDKPLMQHHNINEQILAPEVRLLDIENNNLGVLKTSEALARARELEMDLVEINPKAEPPVCKIIEFTHFKYQKEKELRKQKANAHESEIKGVRLSIRIGEHDMDVRRTQALGFLDRGDKVKAEIILRGRENARPDLAFETLREFQKLLAAAVEIRIEQEPTKQANKVTAIFAKK